MPTAPRRFHFGPERKPWQHNSASKRKITGRALQRERRRLFDDEPLCRACSAKGITKEAKIRDHILALAFGGEDTRENTQPLCQECSDAKTKSESRQGRHPPSKSSAP